VTNRNPSVHRFVSYLRVPSDVAMLIGDPTPNGDGDGDGTLDSLPQAPATAAAAPDAAGRPSDADILAWENRIREESMADRLLVGPREPMAALEAEYASGSPVFTAKVAALARGYDAVRRTRGDGNCFFRAFLFAYLEGLVARRDLEERDRVLRALESVRPTLLDAGYEELVLEAPLEMLIDMLRAIGSPTDPLTLPTLESNARSEDVSNYLVFFLRMVTAAEVRRRADFFAPFVMGMSDLDVESFCRSCVDPMGEEADHVQVVALSDALGIPLRVAYLDRSVHPGGGSGGGAQGGNGSEGGEEVAVDMHDFVPETVSLVEKAPRVHLLYRPGHYDILYPGAGSGKM
jgi:ubiquitin thioesterase protein OTUB1